MVTPTNNFTRQRPNVLPIYYQIISNILADAGKEACLIRPGSEAVKRSIPNVDVISHIFGALGSVVMVMISQACRSIFQKRRYDKINWINVALIGV